MKRCGRISVLDAVPKARSKLRQDDEGGVRGVEGGVRTQWRIRAVLRADPHGAYARVTKVLRSEKERC